MRWSVIGSADLARGLARLTGKNEARVRGETHAADDCASVSTEGHCATPARLLLWAAIW
jgi:hypothetical protein